MRIDKLTDSQLADMCITLLVLLAGTELTAIDSHTRADLITAFGTLPADLQAQVTAAAAFEQEKISMFSTKNSLFSKLVPLARSTRDYLRAANAPKKQYDLCGFDYPAPRSNAYQAQDPTKMEAVGFSNGVNQGSFQGNNPGGRVVYEVWRREGDSGAWHVHILTTKQRFEDTGVTPGQYYEYRVRARAARTTSNFSNSTVVYGVL